MSEKSCPVCRGLLLERLPSWHFACTKCAYEQSSLTPTINDETTHERVDEAGRETALRELRMSNFRTLMQVIRRYKPNGGHLLDVGCAHGWFLEAARDDFEVLGIEPDHRIFSATVARDLPVRNGYFPHALLAAEKFDVIVFNDVLEHIPSISEILNACHGRLNEDGYLVVNLPSSDGLFYRLSRMFLRFGYPGFFERLWQKGLPSPHVHYFNKKNLTELLAQHRFTSVSSGRLPVLSLSGLYTRITYTGTQSRLTRMVIYCAVALSLPILRLFPSDIIFLIAKKADGINTPVA